MIINKSAELGVTMLSNMKMEQTQPNSGANRDNAFYQDIQRAVEKSERQQQPTKPDKAQQKDQDPAKDLAGKDDSTNPADAVSSKGTENKSDKAQDAPEDMAADPAAMAALFAMQLLQAGQQADPAQDVQLDATQQVAALLPDMDAEGEGDVVPELIAPVIEGEEPEVKADTKGTTQDAKFVEQVFDEIRQAVVSNEAERTVSAKPQEAPEQEATGAVRQGEYDYSNKEQQPKETAAKSGAPVMDTAGAHTAQEAPRAASAPVEVALENGELAPRAAQNAFFEGVLEQVQTAVTEQQSELYVQLKPDVLGGLSIRLVMTEEGVSAQVRTSNQHLQAMVSAELSQLEATLRDRGIQLVQMDVIYDQSASNQYLDQQQRQFHQGGQQQSGSGRHVTRIIEDAAPYEQLYESMVPTEMGANEGVEYTA